MSTRSSVRRLRRSELDRILEIENTSFGNGAYDRNLLADFFHKCGDLFLIVERENTIWGYMLTCIRGDRAELISVAIDPAARGQGLASILMESTIRRLRRRGIRRLRLMVRLNNRPARAFYRKYEFQKLRIVRSYYEDGKDGLLMTRVLS